MIGFFQFDNIVKSAVPFLIVTIDVDLSTFYNDDKHRHIRSYTQKFSKDVTSDELLQKISDLKIGKEFPVVIICDDGKKSMQLCAAVEEKGFLNCYYVLDGFKSFSSELS